MGEAVEKEKIQPVFKKSVPKRRFLIIEAAAVSSHIFTFLKGEKRKGRSKSRELLCQPDGHAGKNLLFKSFQWTASLEIESKGSFVSSSGSSRSRCRSR